MATWPGTLPYPNATEHELEDPNVRTQMELGPDRVRARSVQLYTRTTLSWTFSGAELDTFRDFFRVNLNHGRDWFTMPVFTYSAYVNKTVRFVGVARAQYATYDQWGVTAMVEIVGDLSA